VAHRWLGHYNFHWNPLVSFRQRRDELARWIDDNESPRAVLDEDEALGVAVGHRNLRLTMHRTGFDISVGSPRISIEPLEGVFSAVADIFRPRGVHVAIARTVHTYDMEADYKNPRQRLAQRVTGLAAGEGFGPTDCSLLVDFSREYCKLQVEFGIVDADELEERLRGTGMGRLSGLDLPRVSDVGRDFPPLSLLCDSTWRPLRSYPIASDDTSLLWNYIRESISRVNSDCASIADDLGRFVEQEVRDELNLGA